MLRLGLFLSLLIASSSAEELMLEDFQKYDVNSVPSQGWQTREGSAKDIYRIVEENGDKYLEAKANDKSVQLFRDKDWDGKKFPIMRWKWRVKEFPTGAKEKGGKNDSAAGLYVVFPRRWFIPEAIKYVWSEKVPKETMIRKRKQFALIVVRSGAIGVGEWQSEERDVMADYEKIFGRSAPRPVSFGFLTDANDTHSKAAADYDDISVRAK